MTHSFATGLVHPFFLCGIQKDPPGRDRPPCVSALRDHSCYLRVASGKYCATQAFFGIANEKGKDYECRHLHHRKLSTPFPTPPFLFPFGHTLPFLPYPTFLPDTPLMACIGSYTLHVLPTKLRSRTMSNQVLGSAGLDKISQIPGSRTARPAPSPSVRLAAYILDGLCHRPQRHR